MTDLIVTKKPAPLPVPAPELAQKLASFDGMDLVRGTVPALVIEQAKQHLAALEAYHVPAPEKLIAYWCRRLRSGVAPIGEDDFEGRVEAIATSCGDLPAWVWTAETLKLAWREFRFFPTAHELFDLLDAVAQKGLRGLSQVRMLANSASDGAVSAWRDGEKPADPYQRHSAPRSLRSIIGGSNAN